MPPKNGQPLLPGFDRGFVDAVELEELAVSLADPLFHVTIPEVSGEAIRSIRILVQSDVIRAFELNHVIALGLVFVIAPGVSVWDEA